MTTHNITRRTFIGGSMMLGAIAAGTSSAAARDDLPEPGKKKLAIGTFIYPRMDQIDFTGPFAVLSRLPDSEVHVMALERGPIKDHKGLTLTPQITVSEAPALDVLHVPGGPGQEALMRDERVLSMIRRQAEQGRIVFSVCTGALLCGAAGILRGRRATTHWSAFELLHYFGATAVDERVVVDGNIVSAAGVTAGIDGALRLAALLRGDRVAQEIQLDIQYAPEPPFNAGTPQSAPSEVLQAVKERYHPLTEARRNTARALALQPRTPGSAPLSPAG
jgi:cyclohexyl-isocyanide hydratase